MMQINHYNIVDKLNEKRIKMKKIKVLFLITMMITYACSDDTSDVSRTTHFALIKLEGKNPFLLAQGEDYKDPGATATAGDSKIEVKTAYSKGEYFKTKGIDTSTDNPDKYTITYSATNQDGFDAQDSRSVWVAKTGDLVNSIGGLYKSDVQRAPKFEKTSKYSGLSYILIKQTGKNKYEISDALGGYYDIGRNYGSSYAGIGVVITINDLSSGDISISPSKPLFGSAINLTDFTVDKVNKKITFTANAAFSNGTFKVQLTQVKL